MCTTDLFRALVIPRAVVRPAHAAVLILLVTGVLRGGRVGGTSLLVYSLVTQEKTEQCRQPSLITLVVHRSHTL